MANQSFWTTTSGMATGVAGTLTGLVAIAGIAAQAGWIGGANDGAKSTAAGDTTTSSSTTTDPEDATSTTTNDEYGSAFGDDRTGTTEGASRDDTATTSTNGSRTASAGNPTYTVDPTTAVFDPLGPRTKVLSVRNTGTVDLVVQDVDVEGAGASRFAVSSSKCTSAPVDPGLSCTLEVAFTPPSSGEVEATLIVDVEDARTREIPLSGKAIL